MSKYNFIFRIFINRTTLSNLMIFNNKKAQLYVVSAIFLCAFLYALLTQYNWISEEKGLENFESLKNNYEKELTMVLNKCKKEGKDLQKCEQDFTDVYTQKFAKKQDPNFGIISI